MAAAFDPESGLVFNETVEHAISARQLEEHRNWATKPRKPLPPKEPGSVFAKVGVRSLKETALEVLYRNLTCLTPESFHAVPEHLTDEIQEGIKERYLENFYLWKLSSQKISQRRESTLGAFRYRQIIRNPVLWLETYFQPMHSQSFDFLTNLTITSRFSTPDLISLHTLRNLASLSIIGNPSRGSNMMANETTVVDDRIIRAWGKSCAEKGAFPVLRVLRLRHQPELTRKSLDWATKFPALGLYDVRDCNFGQEAKKRAEGLGWWTTSGDIESVLQMAILDRKNFIREAIGPMAPVVNNDEPTYWNDNCPTRRVPRREIVLSGAHRAVKESSYQIAKFQYENRFRYDFRVIGDPPEDVIRRVKPGKASIETSHYNQRQSWDAKQCAIYSRLGELWDDTDLQRTGIAVGDSAVVVGDEVINTVPLASIHLGPIQLGPSSEAIIPVRPEEYDEGCMAFLRLILPKPGVDAATGAEAAAALEPQMTLRSSKRKKLATQLSDFM